MRKQPSTLLNKVHGMRKSTSSDAFDNWTVQVRKGLLELWVLRALSKGECYGYDLVKAIADGGGLGISEGTLYPLLSRLRVMGLVETRLVESAEGPARKYYRLTGAGEQQLRDMNRYWRQLLASLEMNHDDGT